MRYHSLVAFIVSGADRRGVLGLASALLLASIEDDGLTAASDDV